MKNFPVRDHNSTIKKPDLSILSKEWKSPYIAREKVEGFTGGIVNPRYLANLDSKGEGPPRIRVGRKVAYLVKPFIEWLEERASIPDSEGYQGSD